MTKPSSTDRPTSPAHVDLATFSPWPARRKRTRLWVSLGFLGIVLIGLILVAAVARQQIVAAARELGAAQRAFDAAQGEFSYDAAAQIHAGGDRLLREIRPGDRAAGPLVFDVPKGTRLASIVLREAPFSAGVRVTLP